MVRLKIITRNAILLSALVAAGVLTPLAVHKIAASSEAPTPKAKSPEEHREHFKFEEYLVAKGKEPLAWDCQSGNADHVRYFSDSCFAEHIVEMDLGKPNSSGSVLLRAIGYAAFTIQGRSFLNHWYKIDSNQSQALRSLVTTNLPKIPSDSARWAFPRHLTAIEACIDGESYLAIRSRSGEPEFERATQQLATHAGFEATRTSPAHCM